MPWTETEDEVVRRMWRTTTSADLAVLLQKPQRLVQNRAALLGLGGQGVNGRRHSQHTVDKVLRLYIHHTMDEVALITDLTPGQVEGIIKRAKQRIQERNA